ncbi:alanine--tRNA ligase [Candidatus Berkelbacteria bacterium CG10_big_fil_rev_8_21_14_0_10_41_12]|uniref:alanine--tRNA ligase n=1 Tax=Candidatus Berkelbacteria bacterium CG10_big_fil_rev_8_21_14_0_10_41_12 TaxID=1974513 RepID=A0A2M6WWT4_9BACT|nr:MAG: alanine--tRNA ligase [Candidatus Berkelbacteria bacterium CG10_big_fil_rev_8_21_14_0_10_41_12]
MSSQDFSQTIKLREAFLDFFKEKGHKVIPSASLIPENDPSVLFTTAGMQQFKRYYLFPGEAPSSKIATIQKCIRTGDIEEVGDETHLTFFEMLGSFSFGYPKKESSYFKEEAIKLAWEFLTQILQIDKSRISATYFKGEKGVPADNESLEILKKIEGLSGIKPQNFEENFWSLGTKGSPGGPTVEFYVSPSEASAKGDVDDVEVWNLVFNEFVLENGKYRESEYKGVDTGMGLERLAAVMQGKNDIYETDLFWPIIKKIAEVSNKKYQENLKAFRVIADHLKTALFLASENLEPSNLERGYVLRRLIRRAVRYGWNIELGSLTQLIKSLSSIYPGWRTERSSEVISNEEERFKQTIREGLKKAKEVFDKKQKVDPVIYSKIMQMDAKSDILGDIYGNKKNNNELAEYQIDITDREIIGAYITGEEAFNLYQTYGFPIEMIIELAQEEKLFVDIRGFRREVEKHQKLSRTASAGMFKGGLADNRVETTHLHTAAHLLLAALRQVLGEQVEQKGSNITQERLRFDFNNPEKLTPDQIEKIEAIVNEKIEEALPVTMQELSLEEAKKSGATGLFSDRYGEVVKIFTIGNPEEPFSREICGGPHVKNTSELGHFKIVKEESSSAGVRRIKAVLE